MIFVFGVILNFSNCLGTTLLRKKTRKSPKVLVFSSMKMDQASLVIFHCKKSLLLSSFYVYCQNDWIASLWSAILMWIRHQSNTSGTLFLFGSDTWNNVPFSPQKEKKATFVAFTSVSG